MNFEEYAEGYERAVAAIAHADLSGAERAALISQFYKLAFAMRNADDATRVLVEATIADVRLCEHSRINVLIVGVGNVV